MLLENYRDNKLMVLYQKLTRSDFKGNPQDEYIVTLLYALRCIDNCNRNDNMVPEKKYVDFAKEIIRIYETCEDQQANNVSIMAWTKAMLKYMKKMKLRYKDIHKMSACDLINNVTECLE